MYIWTNICRTYIDQLLKGILKSLALSEAIHLEQYHLHCMCCIKMQGANLVFSIHTILFCCLATCLATKQCHTGSGRCYWLGNGTNNQVNAELQCQNDEGHLAVMETEELWNFVMSAFRYVSRILMVTNRNSISNFWHTPVEPHQARKPAR